MEKEQDTQREAKYFIQATYTFSECCKALQVDFKTFKKWLEKDNIESYNSEYDERVKYLTIEQVRLLASRHGRAWPPIHQEPETMTEATAKRLTEQIASTARLTQELRRDQATLHAGLEEQATLRAGVQAQANQLATIQATIEQQEQQTSVALEKITASQQEQRQEQEQLAAQIEQTRTAVDRAGRDIAALEMRQQAALEQAQNALQTQLDTLTAATQEQAKTLGQLTARMEALQDATQRNHQASQQQLEQAQKAVQEQTVRLEAVEAALRLQAELFRQKQEEDRERTKGMVELVETRLRAEQQAALEELQKEMQAQLDQQIRDLRAATEKQARNLYSVIESAEQDEARDIATLTHQQEELKSQIEHAEMRAETATSTALGDQRRIDSLEQRFTGLDARVLEVERRHDQGDHKKEEQGAEQQKAAKPRRPGRSTTKQTQSDGE